MAIERRLQLISDRELVHIAQLGSREAYNELVVRFRGAVLLVAEQILGSRDLAQDVAQEVFLMAFGALAQLQTPEKFASWLYAITRHRARRVALRESRQQPTEDSCLESLVQAQHGTLGNHPLDEVLRAEKQQSVQLGMAGLSPEIQIVLQLFYYEHWTMTQIAEFLSLSLPTIKWRLHTGRNRLHRYLSQLLED